jgi:hypothetical protein
MEKAGYATFKVKDAVLTKKKSTTVTFNYFQENKWRLISFAICPLFTCITNNKDLITRSLRGKLRSTEED